MCMTVSLLLVCIHECSTHGGQKRAVNPLGLVALMCVLGTELRSSGKTKQNKKTRKFSSVLSHLSTSSAWLLGED